MSEVKTAVFPVAGLGARFLPVTKAIPKEMLPIIDKPLIQYAVEEVVAAGIKTLVFVTGKNKRAIEDHFDANLELDRLLMAAGKLQAADRVRNILPPEVQCIFVRQEAPLGLGHAVLCAERVVGPNPFLVVLADDFLPFLGTSVSDELINAYASTKKTQLSVVRVPPEQSVMYGMVEVGKSNSEVLGLIEKPDLSQAPSDLASIGRYIFTPDIFALIKRLEPDKVGEIQLADAIDQQAKKGHVKFIEYKGHRFDCGSVSGYVDAILHEAKERKMKPSPLSFNP